MKTLELIQATPSSFDTQFISGALFHWALCTKAFLGFLLGAFPWSITFSLFPFASCLSPSFLYPALLAIPLHLPSSGPCSAHLSAGPQPWRWLSLIGPQRVYENRVMWAPYRTQWCNCLIAFFSSSQRGFCFLSVRQETLNRPDSPRISHSVTLSCCLIDLA